MKNPRQAPKRKRGGAPASVPRHEEEHEEEKQTERGQQEPPRPRRRAPQHPTSEHVSFLVDRPGHQLFRICTSGYSYESWHTGGSFYSHVAKKDEFEFYASEFNCVELNATFYRWFSESVWEGWRKKAAAIRPSFQYVIKAHQYFTHMKRLDIDEKFRTNWLRFYACCQRFCQHAGPILFQFPARFQVNATNLARLEALGSVLDPNGKFVFEFRHISWFSNPQVNAILKRYNWCFAGVEVHGVSPRWASTMVNGLNPPVDDYPLRCCTWGAYIRFHGAVGQYIGAYGRVKMAEWAGKFSEWATSDPPRTVYAAFNNTDDGRPACAIQDARSLVEGLRALGYS
jgi:uncharacterized protein YecE (DUF72 family)